MKTGFFIGRFQPFHKGHEQAIRHIASENDYVVVGIGSAQEHHTVDNPFTAKERSEMIARSLGRDFPYTIVPIPDINRYDLWVSHVCSLCPDFNVVYTGNRVVHDLFGAAGIDVKAVNHHGYTSATEVRNMISRCDGSWESLVPGGTLEILAACDGVNRVKDIMSNRYSKPSLTVDALVRRDNDILLVRRKHDPFRGSWALPGGFVEIGESTENALARELGEETALSAGSLRLAGVYSEPGRDPRGHVVSVVYHVDASGVPKAGDDAEEARFFNLGSLPLLAFDHERIIGECIKKR